MKERYGNLDGLRALSAVGIILMHVRANGGFGISGFVYDEIIASFTNLTFLFMLLSAFSMCCGYYEKFRTNTISLEQFYMRRYERIWPFFALLCTVELIVDHNLTSLFEWLADISLVFGLLPFANISLVGVGWFIGVIFVFYMLFPFFTFVIGNKRRAWLAIAAAVVMNSLCQVYFFDDAHVASGFVSRTNIVFCSMFFVAGGMIFLYRDMIKTLSIWPVVILSAVSILFYYLVNPSAFTMLVLFVLITILSICSGDKARLMLQNKVIRFIAGVSMELYLCHMFVFRIVERMELLHLTENEVLNYIAVSIATVCGSLVMALVLKEVLKLLACIFKREIQDGVSNAADLAGSIGFSSSYAGIAEKLQENYGRIATKLGRK